MNPAHVDDPRFVGSVEEHADWIRHDVETDAEVARIGRESVIRKPDGSEVPAPTTYAGWEMLDALESLDDEEMSSVMMSEEYYASVTR